MVQITTPNFMRTLMAWMAGMAISGVGAMAAHGAPQAELTVYAAASLKNVADDIGKTYSARTGQPVQFVYGASSTLAHQIENGAKADVFISADVDWMDALAQQHLLRPGSRHNIASNHLALIAPKDQALSLRLTPRVNLAQVLGAGKFALAAPDVPAGRYAKAALTKLGLWDQVADHVVYGQNVRAALLYVSRGEARLGVVYDTDALVEPNVSLVALFPEDSHPPIIYPAAVLQASTDPSAARFVAYLQEQEAQSTFAKYGFMPPLAH